MYGRRDLVDSHLFLRSRLSAAVLRVDPDSPEPPLRRSVTGMKIGIAVAAIAALIVVVLNIFLFTTNDAWRNDPRALIFDESTGTRYLMVDDTLHPVLNLTSAALLVGAPPQIIKVSADDIAAVPRGAGIGEAGLPDTLPSPSAPAPVWTVCAVGDGTAVRVAPSSDAVAVSQDEAVLVAAENELYLLWNGLRLSIAEDWIARALGFEPNTAIDVELRWLDTIPAGADLDLSAVKLGGDGPAIDGDTTTLGQVIQVSGAESDANYVVTTEGLMPVTQTVAALLSAIPGEDLPEPHSISRRVFVSTPVVEPAAWQDELPTTIPARMNEQLAPCSMWEDGEISLAAMAADSLAPTIDVAPGSGLIASTASAPGISGAGLYLVSDTGTKYPVADASTATALGLDGANSPAIPEELLALLPTGPLIAQ